MWQQLLLHIGAGGTSFRWHAADCVSGSEGRDA
jgi:hypothetical protein